MKNLITVLIALIIVAVAYATESLTVKPVNGKTLSRLEHGQSASCSVKKDGDTIEIKVGEGVKNGNSWINCRHIDGHPTPLWEGIPPWEKPNY